MKGIEVLPEREKEIISSYPFKDFFEGKMDRDEYLKQLELFKPQLEGIIDSSLIDYLEWLGKKQMGIATFIPDNTLVKSQVFLMEQYLLVNYSELKKYFSWIKKQSEYSIIQNASYLTIKELKPNVQKWEEANRRGIYTLDQCIKYEMCTCFHRAVFFNLLMQQVGLETSILSGKWIETNQENIESGVSTNAPSKSDYHLWNIILYKNKYFLIDTSFLINNKPIFEKINFIPKKGLKSLWTIKTHGDFMYRHYSSNDTIEIEVQVKS